MKLSKRTIEAALPEGYGIDKAEGVWCFYGNDSAEWYSRCSDFCTLNQGTLEQWIKAFNRCRETKGQDGYGIER